MTITACFLIWVYITQLDSSLEGKLDTFYPVLDPLSPTEDPVGCSQIK